MELGIIISVVALVIGAAGAFLAWRKVTRLGREARQDILNLLPDPVPTPLSVSRENRIDTIMRTSLDLSQLEARFAMPKKELYKQLEKLFRQGKIQVFIQKGIATGGHPTIQEGARLLIPFIHKGGLPPDLRADDEEVIRLFSELRKRPRR